MCSPKAIDAGAVRARTSPLRGAVGSSGRSHATSIRADAAVRAATYFMYASGAVFGQWCCIGTCVKTRQKRTRPGASFYIEVVAISVPHRLERTIGPQLPVRGHERRVQP